MTPSISEDELGRLRAVVDHLGYDLEPSILIGGWATHLRVGGEASKDIDLIINSPELRQRLQSVLEDYSESRHSGGKKVRGTVNGIHIDAYLPHDSRLGDRLLLDVDKLAKYTDAMTENGWLLLTIDAHSVTKMAALLDRADTEKGSKDAREILALFGKGVDAAKALSVLIDATAGPVNDVPGHVADVFDRLAERGGVDGRAPNKKQREALRVMKRQWVELAERMVRVQREGTQGTRPSFRQR